MPTYHIFLYQTINQIQKDIKLHEIGFIDHFIDHIN